ncbi:MAG: hypothetical protein SNH63_01255 [Rikenellaceae bacterium]
MKSKGLFISALLLGATLLPLAAEASADKTIRTYPSMTKGEVVERMERLEWAKPMLKMAHDQVDQYVERHVSDSIWIISRLQMYWKNHYTTPYINGGEYSRAEGHAPVPTVRFTGGRDWSSIYRTPSLEDIRPFMDYNDDQIYLQNPTKPGSPWEWVDTGKSAHKVEGINVSIVTKAMYSAFLYWLDGDERYAKFAYDILKVFTDGLYYREAPVAEGDTRNAHVVGLTSFEVIHEGVIPSMTLCYDFLYDYLHERRADVARMQAVFQKFADQVIVNGVSDNNWNVFQARFISYLALVLESDADYENGKGREYYADFLLNKSVERQRALKEVRDIYDPNTAMWNESPIYSTNTTKDLLEALLLLDGLDGENLLCDFEIVERAAVASMEYEMPNLRTTGFGDNGYSLIDNTMFESLLSFYKRYGMDDKLQSTAAVLNDRVANGLYERKRGVTMYKLFNYVEDLGDIRADGSSLYSALFYAPNVNLSMLRSGLDRQNALMLINAGTGFNHNSDNGMSLELYGEGYVLGVDKGRGSSYWSADHREYYKAAVSHNTVVVDGRSKNSSPEMLPGESSPQHALLSYFPVSNRGDAAREVSILYADNTFHETSTNSQQRRTNGVVRTSESSGYYVDIFRSSKIEGGDKMHEYLYHNVGQSLTISAAGGEALAMGESQDLTSAGGRAKGYDYMTQKREVSYDGDIRATFELDPTDGRDKVSMDVWMKGEEGRTIFSVMTPKVAKGYSGVLPKSLDDMEIPLLLVRQSGEAWDRPFVAIYEPYSQSEGRSIESVNYTDSRTSDLVMVEVCHSDKSRELIFNNTEVAAERTPFKGVEFEGIYGVVAMSSSDKLERLFLGNGRYISMADCAIIASDDCVTALVEWRDGVLSIESDGAFSLALPRSTKAELSYVDQHGVEHTIVGRRAKTQSGVRMLYDIE